MLLAIVPNAYPELDATRIKALGNIRMVIYGNFGIGAATTAMQDAFRRIVADGSVQNVHKDIVASQEVFRLQGMEETKADEKRFLR